MQRSACLSDFGAVWCVMEGDAMLKPTVTAKARVDRALSAFGHSVPDDVRDLMVSLVQDAEMDCAISALVEATTASALAAGIVKTAARQAMYEFNQSRGAS